MKKILVALITVFLTFASNAGILIDALHKKQKMETEVLLLQNELDAIQNTNVLQNTTNVLIKIKHQKKTLENALKKAKIAEEDYLCLKSQLRHDYSRDDLITAISARIQSGRSVSSTWGFTKNGRALNLILEYVSLDIRTAAILDVMNL